MPTAKKAVSEAALLLLPKSAAAMLCILSEIVPVSRKPEPRLLAAHFGGLLCLPAAFVCFSAIALCVFFLAHCALPKKD